MYTIGQFSFITRLPVKTLRYYDEIGLLRPARVDEATGYRYYGVEEMTQAATITLFRDLDFSLAEVAELVGLARNGDLGDLAEWLRRQERVVSERKVRYETLLARLRTLTQDLEKEADMEALAVIEKQLDEQVILTLRKKGRYEELGPMYGQLFQFAGMHGIAPAGPPVYICRDEEYQPEEADLEAAVPVAGDRDAIEAAVRDGGGPIGDEAVDAEDSRGRVGMRVLPGGRALAVTHVGPYERVGAAYKVLMDTVAQRGLEPTGPSREIYLTDPTQVESPEEYVTEVVLPVR